MKFMTKKGENTLNLSLKLRKRERLEKLVKCQKDGLEVI